MVMTMRIVTMTLFSVITVEEPASAWALWLTHLHGSIGVKEYRINARGI